MSAAQNNARPHPNEDALVRQFWQYAVAIGRNVAEHHHDDPEACISDAILGMLLGIRRWDGRGTLKGYVGARADWKAREGSRKRQGRKRAKQVTIHQLDESELSVPEDHREKTVGRTLDDKEWLEYLLAWIHPSDRDLLEEVVMSQRGMTEVGREVGFTTDMVEQRIRYVANELRETYSAKHS